MRVMRVLGMIVLLAWVQPPHVASAECTGSPESPSPVSLDLGDLSTQITEKMPDKLTGDQLALMKERVVDLKNAAEAQKQKALDAQKALNSPAACGAPTLETQAECLQKQIDQDKARMALESDEMKTKTKEEIDLLELQLKAPQTLTQASSDYAQASSTLQTMVDTNDFSWKAHLGIIGKAIIDPATFKALLTPGPIVALSAGMAGYGIARATSLDKDSKAYYLADPATGPVSKITDQIGYAYPVLAPFLIVAAITKSDETMKTFDALVVGTALSEAIVEPLKYAVGECRPNGSDCLGFPSGHATQTFMMATVLDHEYPGHHHIVGIAAAAGAALVSFYRVKEGNHNPGEIFAGMGIGIATGIAASVGVDNQYDAAEGQKRAYWKDAAVGTFRVGKTDKVIHCVPVGIGGACNLTW